MKDEAVQDPESRFSDFEFCGPDESQEPADVTVPPSLKDLLLADEARTNDLTLAPGRGKAGRRRVETPD